MNMQETKDISPYKQGLRDVIIDAAIKSFAEKGIRSVKMDDVAAELSISKRTLYEIFDRKEDLLFEGVKLFYQNRTAVMEIKAQHCKNVIEIILEAYRMKVEEVRQTNPQFYADLVKYPKVAQFLNEQNLQMRVKMQKFIQRGINEGFFRDDVNYEIVGRLFDAIGKYVVDNQLYRQYTIEELFHNLVFVSLRGMCTEKGVKALAKML